MQCPKCLKSQSFGEYCTRDGTKLGEDVIAKCGHKFFDEFMYCHKCGTKMEKGEKLNVGRQQNTEVNSASS